MQYVRKRKKIMKRVLIAASLLCCLLLLVLLINIDKFYAKFIYRGNLEGKVVVPSKSSTHSFSPSPNMAPAKIVEFNITYNANGGYYNNDTNMTNNTVKYINNSIAEGKYIIPTFTNGSFRKWYTTQTFDEGTEFDINNYNGEDIEVFAYSEESRTTFNLSELIRILNEKGYNETLRAIVAEASIPDSLPEEWQNIEISEYQNDEYEIINIEANTDYLPIIFWYTKEDNILHWYSQDPNPIVKIAEESTGLKDYTALENISGLEYWDVKELTQMNEFFANCTSLKDLAPISYWNVSNVTSMKETFSGLSALTDAEAINNWNITSVTDYSKMFYNTEAKPVFTLVNGEFDTEGTFIPNNE